MDLGIEFGPDGFPVFRKDSRRSDKYSFKSRSMRSDSSVTSDNSNQSSSHVVPLPRTRSNKDSPVNSSKVNLLCSLTNPVLIVF